MNASIEAHPELLESFETALRNFQSVMRESLPLNAASNVMSPAARTLLATELADATSGSRPEQAGAQLDAIYLREIEALARRLLADLFNAPYAELRPLSGSLANVAALFGMTSPGDTVMMPSSWAFGHKSFQTTGFPGRSSLRLIEIPWDGEHLLPDVTRLRQLAREVRPKLIILGMSRILFPEPHAEVAEIATEVRAKTLYDGAHVLGLIAGGAYPNPLDYGFDVLAGSTHKTLPGPLGGVLLCRHQSDYDSIRDLCDAAFSSYGSNRTAAFTYALLELAKFGPAYATQIVSNARALATALAKEGFDLVGGHDGYTRTHQVLVDLTDVLPIEETHQCLAAAGIVCNRPVKVDSRLRGGRGDGWWLRLGTTCVTRLGMTEAEMQQVALLLRRILLDRESLEAVRRVVLDWSADYRSVHYTFGTGVSFYANHDEEL